MRVSGSFGLGSLTPVTTARPQTPVAEPSSSKIADPVTFSSVARSRAEGIAHPRWGALSAKLHADPEVADQVVHDFVHNAQQEVLDVTEWAAGKGPIRYSATGEPYTPESRARFAKMAQDFQTASAALYDRERAKGTASADIFDKLVALGDAQSAEFRKMANWDAVVK